MEYYFNGIATQSKSIFIKNMVCNRCIMVVGQIFKAAGINTTTIQLGKVEVDTVIPEKNLEHINSELNNAGFELINNQTVKIAEQIKSVIIDFVYNNHETEKVNFSSLLSSKMNKDYNYLSSLFSAYEGTTIEHYIINLKIERVKELLVYDEKTLGEIAFEMGYSSVAHLSGQFKKVTGFSPSYFKKLKERKRKSINDI